MKSSTKAVCMISFALLLGSAAAFLLMKKPREKLLLCCHAKKQNCDRAIQAAPDGEVSGNES